MKEFGFYIIAFIHVTRFDKHGFSWLSFLLNPQQENFLMSVKMTGFFSQSKKEAGKDFLDSRMLDGLFYKSPAVSSHVYAKWYSSNTFK